MTSTPDAASDPVVLATLRRLLLALVVFGCAGLIVELAVLGHWEEWRQQIPLVLLGALATGAAASLVRADRRAHALVRAVGVLSVLSGVVGSVLHWRANAALELEIDPAIAGTELFGAALGGGVPTLAPGAMIQLGLLAGLAVWRRPVGSASRHLP